MMQIIVPDGVAPGQSFVAQLPSGEQMQVECPPGVSAGQPIMIQLPQQSVAVAMPTATVAHGQAIPMGLAITPEAGQQALQIGGQDQVPLLDPATAGMLATMNSFRVNQRVRFWETLSGGCCEQSNVYDVFDEVTGAHVFIAQEKSEDCNRCFCNPQHSLRVEFKAVNHPDRQWMKKADIEALPTVMTFEREGCFSKPGLGCCICAEDCKDGMVMSAGPPLVDSKPGNVVIQQNSFAYATQPKCGGYFTPTLNLFNRMGTGGEKEEAFVPLAKVEGPFIFGGCSELCCDSTFKVSSMTKEQLDTKILSGDLARITKKKPKGLCACGKELFTDSDTFTVHYNESVGLTPQQKAAMMGSLILSDYMFFEQDYGMVQCEGGKLKITLCDMYCCGCVLPFVITLDQNSAGGGGAPPANQEMQR